MIVRDGIYAVLAFIANTLIRRVVNRESPGGMEGDGLYKYTLREHYKFILTDISKAVD